MIHGIGLGAGKNWLRRGIRRWRRKRNPVTVQEITTALDKLQLESTRVLMVHSSLSACGFVEGGAPVIIRILRDWCGGATLAMPSHSYCYPNKDGVVPIFDPERTASVVGAITDVFWRQSEVKRSLHPTHSLAGLGRDADELIARHADCDTPCGRGTPYERLVAWDASVLMFGVTLDSYTLFHTAEDAACVPYLYESYMYQLKVRGPGGVCDFPMRRQDMRITRRFAEMDRWLESHGLLRRQRCGNGELLLLPHSGAIHEAVTKALRDDPWLLVASDARPRNSMLGNA